MKNAIASKVTIFTLLCALLVTCTTVSDINIRADKQASKIPEDVAEYFNCTGLKSEEFKYDGEYAYSKDIAVNVVNLRKSLANRDTTVKPSPNGKIDQYVVNTIGVVSIQNVSNIRYFIDASVNSIPLYGNSWATQIDNAAQDWNNVFNCRVNFVKVNQANQADLTFYGDNSSSLPSCAQDISARGGTNVYATADFPTSDRSGAFIAINRSFSDVNTLGNETQRTVIKHEIGHALGLRHSDQGGAGDDPNACGGGVFGNNLVKNTQSADVNSIMNSTIPNDNLTRDFDNDDNRTAQIIYPDEYSTPGLNNLAIASLGGQGDYEVTLFLNFYTPDWQTLDIKIFNANGTLVRSLTATDIRQNGYRFTFTRAYNTSYKISWNLKNYRGDYQSPVNEYNFTLQ